MDRVATLLQRDRMDLFSETGSQMGLDAAIVEKDFWVCWTLGHLFDIQTLRDVFVFKGGTSLSKVFALIDRFSEDIDVIIDVAKLGIAGEHPPSAGMSRTKREHLLGEMTAQCQKYISEVLTPTVRARFDAVLGARDQWSLRVAADDPNTVLFHYPTAGTNSASYIERTIRIELGAHAALEPSDAGTVTPFAAEIFPDVFDHPTAALRAIKAERTFWEKATILHVEHHRPADKPMPARHARHYYDMAMLARSPLCDAAVADLELLKRVVAHKSIYYYAKWSRYDLAVPGTLSLLPKPEGVSALRTDYAAMRTMFFHEPPSLDEILADLAALEARINQ